MPSSRADPSESQDCSGREQCMDTHTAASALGAFPSSYIAALEARYFLPSSVSWQLLGHLHTEATTWLGAAPIETVVTILTRDLQLKLGTGLCGKPAKHKEQQKARKFRQCSQGDTQVHRSQLSGAFLTWIITCFCLQLLLLNPLVKAQSSCGNPVTDDVNDIAKLVRATLSSAPCRKAQQSGTLQRVARFMLAPFCRAASYVGNLPNDYMITLKYVPKMDSLPSHCWLHLMVPEFSISLHNLLQKFSDIPDMTDVLSNYSIINNLTRIINDLMACLAFDKNKDFVKENGHLYEEGHFIPEDFFRHFNSTIEVYKESADRLDKNDCILPSTVGTPENDSRVAVTKTFLFPPVAASSLRNDSIGSSTSSNKEALGFISSSSLQGISIALTSLLSLLIGFILGALYWKKIHPKSRAESDETTQCHDYQEENEIRNLKLIQNMGGSSVATPDLADSLNAINQQGKEWSVE
ncbi:hypothetical protein EK904_001628, partial [Melospiza melodia maxima]